MRKKILFFLFLLIPKNILPNLDFKIVLSIFLISEVIISALEIKDGFDCVSSNSDNLFQQICHRQINRNALSLSFIIAIIGTLLRPYIFECR